MENDPFSQVFSALWAMVEGCQAFTDLVPVGNRIRYDQNSRDPIKAVVQAADMPEVILVSDGLTANLHATSSTSMCIRRYTWLITTGDLRINEFCNPVEFAVFRAMLRWKEVLCELTYKGQPFVKRANVVSVTSGTSDPKQNRNLLGWSALWSVEVEMHFNTSDLLLCDSSSSSGA